MQSLLQPQAEGRQADAALWNRWAGVALELPRPAQGTSRQGKDDSELDRGSWVPPLSAASRNGMLLWLVSVWL